MNAHMHRALHEECADIKDEPSMHAFRNPKTGNFLKQGEVIKRPVLVTTLRAIQENPDDLYTGHTAQNLVEDFKNIGALITLQDLNTTKPSGNLPFQLISPTT